MIIEGSISFIIPCYNSAQTIGLVIEEIIATMKTIEERDYEIIAVDDFSSDNVYDVLYGIANSNDRIRVIRFARNFGQHAALMAGIRESRGSVIVTLDDDGQCPVDHLLELISPLERGYDISFARYQVKKQGILKNVGSYINQISTNTLTSMPKDVWLSNFIAFKRFIADEIIKYDGPYPCLSGLLGRSGHRIANVEMEERKRLYGNTNYSFRKLCSFWVSGITSFSIKPLRAAVYTGFLFAIFGILYAVFIVIRKYMDAVVVPGWSTLVALMSVLGGTVLIVLGIIGEYIGRIYMAVNETPQYVISESFCLGDKCQKG